FVFIWGIPIVLAGYLSWLILHGNYLIPGALLTVMLISFLSGRRLDIITSCHSFKAGCYSRIFKLINWQYLTTLPAYLYYPLIVNGHRIYNLYFKRTPLTASNDTRDRDLARICRVYGLLDELYITGKWEHFACLLVSAAEAGLVSREDYDLSRLTELDDLPGNDFVLRAYGCGLVKKRPDVDKILDYYKREELRNSHSLYFYYAIEAGAITDIEHFGRHFRTVLDFHNHVYGAMILENAISSGIISTQDEFDKYYNLLISDDRGNYLNRHYALCGLILTAHKAGFWKEKLDFSIRRAHSDDEEDLMEETILQIKAYRSGCSKEMPDISDYLDRWGIDEVIRKIGKYRRSGWMKVLRFAMENNVFVDSDIFSQVSVIGRRRRLPVRYVAQAFYLARRFGLGDDFAEQLLARGREVLSEVWKRNRKARRKDERIDYREFLRRSAVAVANMSAISDKLCRQILDHYLYQRGYLPLLRDVFEVFAYLSSEKIAVLRQFYAQTGTRFISNPGFLIQITDYLNTYLGLELSFDDFKNDLLLSTETEEEILRRLGGRVISVIAEKVGIEIDINRVQARDYSVLKEWDTRYLGILYATKDKWHKEDKELFTLLIKSALEGTDQGLLNPAVYDDYPLKVYGDTFERKAREVRCHNLSIFRQMQKHRLNIHAWLYPNQAVEPYSTVVASKYRIAETILVDFKQRLDGFRDWLKTHPDKGDWLRIKKTLGPWARIDVSHPNTALLNNTGALEKLHLFVRQIIAGFTQEEVPDEEITDLALILDEISRYKPHKTQRQKGYCIRFWRRQVGRDIFAGNYARSCTALSSNASAIFEFLLDIGTQYIFIEDEEGRVKGYMRFFLALNKWGKPSLFIDSVDGREASAHRDEMKQYVISFAKKVGIPKSRILERGDSIKEKVGGALTGHYFHHSRIKVEKPYTDFSAEDWKPKGGWKKQASSGSVWSKLKFVRGRRRGGRGSRRGTAKGIAGIEVLGLLAIAWVGI
ncbi:MAG: hypothetical protein JRI96_17300, partial [Deltaproteobacteria bacterium]|nr:hypothetical protein [Deltaproteobacteria bacterium]